MTGKMTEHLHDSEPAGLGTVLVIGTCAMGLLALAISIPAQDPSHAYVRPCHSQYCVVLARSAGSDITISKPVPMEEAAELTQKVNCEMQGRWATNASWNYAFDPNCPDKGNNGNAIE